MNAHLWAVTVACAGFLIFCGWAIADALIGRMP